MSAWVWLAAAVASVLAGFAVTAWLDSRRHTEPDVPAMAAVCAACGRPAGKPAGWYPAGWSVVVCEHHQLAVPVCCIGCAHTYMRRHHQLEETT